MKKYLLHSLIILVAIVFLAYRTCAQISAKQDEKRAADDEILSIFADVQRGILQGNVGLFTQYFSPQIYLNVQNIGDGYYSSNQASSLLENFFNMRRTLNFKLSTYVTDVTMPYATGGGLFVYRGSRETLQVYVSLVKHQGRWVIAQFNVY